jgi:hypothetical protein
MNSDTARTLFTYAIAILVLIGAFFLIYQGRGDSGQAWLAVGAVFGYVFRDAGGAAATSNAVRIAAAQPTTTATAGPPATVTTTPTPTDG